MKYETLMNDFFQNIRYKIIIVKNKKLHFIKIHSVVNKNKNRKIN